MTLANNLEINIKKRTRLYNKDIKDIAKKADFVDKHHDIRKLHKPFKKRTGKERIGNETYRHKGEKFVKLNRK